MQSSNFCDLYPRFLETTETAPSRNRIDNRWRAIIGWNEPYLAGRRVLDLGCHDGRWSFAALMTGAAHVVGVEARAHLVEKARDNFTFYRIPRDAYELINGDAIDVMRLMRPGGVDVVLCLGFFYHTLEHMRLLLEAKRLGAEFLIIDTAISAAEEPIISLHREAADDTRNSIDYGKTGSANVLVGMPSRSGLIAMLDYVGYGVVFFDWQGSGVDDWAGMPDYAANIRVTARARRRAEAVPTG
ncbi:MAG TPA: methyltransferase domain-containing protein [Stellaceae bacterium]|nr:methyltransferase domain-containing protein [Stellaceae bacterium]